MVHMLERIGFLDETWPKTNMAKPPAEPLADNGSPTMRHSTPMPEHKFRRHWAKKGDVIILDNLPSHKSQHAAGLLRERGMVLVLAIILTRS